MFLEISVAILAIVTFAQSVRISEVNDRLRVTNESLSRATNDVVAVHKGLDKIIANQMCPPTQPQVPVAPSYYPELRPAERTYEYVQH